MLGFSERTSYHRNKSEVADWDRSLFQSLHVELLHIREWGGSLSPTKDQTYGDGETCLW